MIRRQGISRRAGESGVVIILVAVVLLFVVGAMAVLAIDLVSLYTARSEAQLAADAGALAGARVLANSGATSASPTDTTLASDARLLAIRVARRVAASNRVGGRTLNPNTEVTADVIGDASAGIGGVGRNPRVSVQVRRNDLPAFFARIWGTAQLSLSASAQAEAYNPSGLNLTAGVAPPVAPICVKPWVLPNLDPEGNPLFNATTGAIISPMVNLIGWNDIPGPGHLRAACTGFPGYSCLPNLPSPVPPEPGYWKYYAGSQTSFPPPTEGVRSCTISLDDYQRSIVGCVSTPIECNANVTLDGTDYFPRNLNTQAAVNCLTHSENDAGDRVDESPPGQSFQFIAGQDNPIIPARDTSIMVSDSLVTVPVFDIPAPGNWPPAGNSVRVIGFVQLFLNPNGLHAPIEGPGIPDPMKSTIVNLVGCGTNASGTPIVGNGASPVAVRLITPPAPTGGG